MRVRRKIAYSLLAAGLVLGLGELIARFWYAPEAQAAARLFEYDSEKYFRLKANQQGTFVGKPVRTNSRGFRDREVTVEPGAGVMRILSIGDSVAFGHGVLADETYSAQLQTQLASNGSGRRYEVVNTAAPGNGPLQEVVDLRRGLELKPQAAIIQFTLNDVVEPYLKYRRFGGSGFDYHEVSDLGAWHEFFTGHSALYLFLSGVINSWRLGAITDEEKKRAALRAELYSVESLVNRHGDQLIREAWTMALDESGRIAETCRTARLQCVWLVTPFRFQFVLDPSMDHPQRTMADFAAKHGFPIVDILTVVRAEGEADWQRMKARPNPPARETVLRYVWSRYFLDDSHLTPAGHSLVASLLLPFF